MPYAEEIENILTGIYSDMLWLSKQPHNTPAQARAWYSHVRGKAMATKLKIFTGKVSQSALNDLSQALVLEHYDRLLLNLTALLGRHVNDQINNPEEFIGLIERCEKVNITTAIENHHAQTAEGDYAQAGIELVDWSEIKQSDRIYLWNKKLKGLVGNAEKYDPKNTS